ncbi:MAG TPA: GntR family transcriptional regulator [Longimicrobium sp.]|jgi:DNA-binding transcriptional regulator YhcF (GntR family)|uniref:GntR family transcriptional regulator n=1 Tax=Longimicrobium sp. TaxID=2029185 RepID=UPI002ED8A54B
MRRRAGAAGAEDSLEELIRGRIVAGIHVGRLSAGDRLPSYREVADEVGSDLRAVARAYAALERKGLVQVRGRSGVFVAPQERVGGRVLADTAGWFVDVLREAWHRRIPAASLSAFARECTAARVVRCAFLESTVDQVESIGAELRDDFGFEVCSCTAEHFGSRSAQGGPPREARGADFIATTAFHAAELHEAAAQLGVPLVVICINPQFIREVQRTLSQGGLTVVCVDPLFAERIRLVAGEVCTEGLRTVLAADRGAVEALDLSRPVLVSVAARRLLHGMDLPRSFPDQPMISPESARELHALLVRFNLEVVRGPAD